MTSFASRLSRERGFTLIELLVTVLIIGILAAIALPAFLGQRQKSQDSSAKTMSRHAATAAESFAVDTGGYSTLTIGAMQGIEPVLNDGGSVQAIAALVGAPTATAYTVTTQSRSGKYFTISKDRSTGVMRRCSSSALPTTACAASDW